jgi:hypothetical protein
LSSAQEPQPKREIIWKIVNSAFVIWFLSTIVVGITTWSYSNWQEQQRGDRELNQKIQRLDAEISYRFDVSNQSRPEYPDDTFVIALCYSPIHVEQQSKPLVNNSSEAQWQTDRYVFPEFKDRSLFSLMWELEQIVPESEKEAITQARKTLEEMRDVARSNNLESGRTTEEYLNSPEFSRWKM